MIIFSNSKILIKILYSLILITGIISNIFPSENLVKNSSFEKDSHGYLSNWDYEAFIQTDEAVRFYQKENEGHSGNRCLGIANLLPNDSKAIQWINVESDKLYRLSCWIRTEYMIQSESGGANISVLGLSKTSRFIRDTKGEWEYVELYGRTGKNQKELAVVARLGFYGKLITGIAYFDDVTFEEVKDVPSESALIFKLYDKDEPASEEDVVIIKKTTSIPVGLIITILVIILIGVLVFFIIRNREEIWEKVKDLSLFDKVPKKKKKKNVKRERRKAERFLRNLSVIIKKSMLKGKYQEIELITHDVSDAGIFVLSDDETILDIREEVFVEVIYNEKRFNIGRAKVVRKQKGFNEGGVVVESGFGLVFTSLRTSVWKAVALSINEN